MSNSPLFHKRPLPAAALGLLLGILAARCFGSAICYGAACVMLLLCGFLFYRKQMRYLPVLLLIPIGLLRMQWAIPSMPPTQSNAAALRGVIADTPFYEEDAWQLRLRDASINGDPVSGHILLTLSDGPANTVFRYGDQIALTAAVYPLRHEENEGGFNAYPYYLGKGIVATAYSSDKDAQLLPGASDLYGLLLSFRSSIKHAVYDLLGPEYGPLAAGMLLGDTQNIADSVLQRFRDGGIAHLLAVSGLHVTLLCGALYFLLRRARWNTRFFVILGFLLVYCVLTGFAPSAMRASMMSACLFLARGIHRRFDGPSALALAFLLLALINPFLVFSASLQLSFGAMGGLLLLTPIFQRCFSFLPDTIQSALAASCSAQLGIFPFSATMFHRFSLFGIFINLLVIPLAALVLLPLAAALLLYPLAPALATPVAGVARVTLMLMESAAAFSAGFGTILLPGFSAGATACYGCACLFLSPLCLLRFRWRAALSALCLLLCLFLVLLPIAARPRAYISVLSCEPGYAIHLHGPDSDILLTDGSSSAQYAAERYAQALCLPAPTWLTSKQKEQWLGLGPHTVRVTGDLVQVSNSLYSLQENGRLRISLKQGAPLVTAYGTA